VRAAQAHILHNVGLNPPLHSLQNEGVGGCIASTPNAAIRRLATDRNEDGISNTPPYAQIGTNSTLTKIGSYGEGCPGFISTTWDISRGNVGLNPPLHTQNSEGVGGCNESSPNAAIRRLGLPSVKAEFPTYIVRPGINDRPIINVDELGVGTLWD
ncbi:receptor-like protein kinase, partial [Trifolium medium]|nr:receptor-like protein kinase [Trifolium medium]